MTPEIIVDKPQAQVPTQKQAGSLSWHWAALAAIVLASSGHLLIKFGLLSMTHPVVSMNPVVRLGHYLLQPPVAAGLAIYGLGTLFWISAVSRRDISFLYPLTALNYVVVSLGGKLLFGEATSPGRWTGIAVVVAGVALLQLSMREQRV